MAVFRIIPVAILLAVCGCVSYTRPIVPPAEMTRSEKNFQAVWDAGREVLRSYRFTVNHRDRRAGLMTTDPMGGRHFFEWWRRDKATATGALENSVQPMYRVVSLQIRKTDEGKYDPVVSVTVSRLLSGGSGGNRFLTTYKLVPAPNPEDLLIVAVASSDKTRGDSDGHRPGDAIFAEKIAEDIRRLAARKLAG